MTGHITSRVGDELLVNPWGLWWAEVSASDMLTIDAAGAVTSGEWDVTPAVHIHTELHRRRPDAAVVVHNHPPYDYRARGDRRAPRARPPELRRSSPTSWC